MSTSGLAHATCTKYLLLGTLTASLVALSTTAPSATASAPTATAAPSAIATSSHANALLASAAHALGFTHPASLLFALAALYRFRVLERLWGPARFAVHPPPPTSASQQPPLTASQTFLATALPAALLLPRALLPAALPAGHAATALLHALLSHSCALVPPAWRYASTALPVLGGGAPGDASLKVSAKWPEYAACAQVALVQGLPGIACAGIGWAVGYAWRAGMATVLRRDAVATGLVNVRAGDSVEAVGGAASTTGTGHRAGSESTARRR